MSRVDMARGGAVRSRHESRFAIGMEEFTVGEEARLLGGLTSAPRPLERRESFVLRSSDVCMGAEIEITRPLVREGR